MTSIVCQLATSTKAASVESVIKTMCKILSCQERRALDIYDAFPRLRSIEATDNMKTIVKELSKFGVSNETIVDNPKLFLMTPGKFTNN